ncbi:uracil-DNA glycosylase [Fodinibius sediminis]|uniref:Type-4 uracil-DNA glycosylase n=1 Tax=Fodinibius sediminis TaxID=1214077 RepID=A0A521B4F5_9BACT|nr:uracil-DNA glycosylase [Fodinibius sediminis]SMO41921.1 DNA polymerase [Fodinibius sediminis]
MDNSEQSPRKLIDDIIHFISQERSLYGDFMVNETNAAAEEEASVTDDSSSSSPVRTPEAKSSDPPDKDSAGKAADNIYDQINQCNTLEELEALCRKADVLRTDLQGTQLVFGVGNPKADLMLIGEAPGAEEDKQGEPFVGRAGQLLDKILAAINFKRDEVYIANILKHRPPKNRNPKPEERERSLPFLLRQIDLVNPKLILSLGKVSAQTLLDKNLSLSKMRGKFHPFRDKYELLATYHPAALLRHSKWKRPTWKDVQRLRKRYDELGGKP